MVGFGDDMMPGWTDYYTVGLSVVIGVVLTYLAWIALYRFYKRKLHDMKIERSAREELGIVIWFLFLAFSVPTVLGWIILTLLQ